ncbi:unnamed protein product [Penicillium roqueforti FM164]|uniref:Genomic scaffold, ProqFM164S03 n=1 Tax=Penicillium roqueforti (strain FM164) TaxID=1365484 RepID=W6QZ39_PENRF|nr:unnamed protein product [Penicillium roqueforti FM164]
MIRQGARNMFEETRLVPDAHYAKAPAHGKEQLRILHYGTRSFNIAVFVDIIIAEYRLREIVQQEKSLKRKVRVIEKIAADKYGDKAAQYYNQELTILLRQYSEAEYKLYLAEIMLPIGPSNGLENCMKRGGCCSRDCGCCHDRHERTERNKGIGHCTPTCDCCSRERGFNYTARERQGFVEDFKKKQYDNNPACVIQMVEAFFLLPVVGKPQVKTQGQPQPGQGGNKRLWKRIFRKT